MFTDLIHLLLIKITPICKTDTPHNNLQVFISFSSNKNTVSNYKSSSQRHFCYQFSSQLINFTLSYNVCFYIYLKEIVQDRSEGKVTSHGRLLLFIEKYNDPNVLARVYLKVQLVSLCEAYEVNFRRSDTKKNLATAIIGALRNHTSIPFIAPVDDRQYQVVETETNSTNGSVRMRFRLSGNYSLE